MKEVFRKFANRIAFAAGSPAVFILALMVVILWAATGPLFDFSNTWQLGINTITTITTFLMVFLIQNTQNRDIKEVHLQLDELIRPSKTARDMFVDLEDMTDDELQALDAEFRQLHEKQVSSATMKKLHAKIVAESSRRGTIEKAVDVTSHAVNNILKPHNHNSKNDDNSPHKT